ncbi:hypothetical protein [Cohnella fermenti]|uniref:Uncharacterized protein n=1 Tax=Cohnella fermenti TaxID=2565925 RepID=A0A4S4BT21_9BACL|nr:hypothetical protein [Cohnella fermenti]THF78034.1 hypothetical protein E6C55_15150 [Cohnella fermenti]
MEKLILEMMEKMTTGFAEIKGEIAGIKSEIVEIKGEIIVMKGEIAEIKEDIVVMKSEIAEIKVVQAEHGVKLDRIELSLEGIREQAAASAEDITGLRLVHKKE